MTNSIIQFAKQELSGWKKTEAAWLAFCVGATLILSVIAGDTALGMISSSTATMYTVIAGKGKRSCYFFGMINTLGYGFISMNTHLYGEVMLNWGYYFPMMFAGLYFWKRNLNRNNVIVKTYLSAGGRITAAVLSIYGFAVYAAVLGMMGDTQPLVDSFTTVFSITAMVLTVRRCIEQWLIWTAVNAVSTVMWLRVWLATGESFAIVLMWCVAFANGIIFFIQWRKSIAAAATAPS